MSMVKVPLKGDEAANLYREMVAFVEKAWPEQTRLDRHIMLLAHVRIFAILADNLVELCYEDATNDPELTKGERQLCDAAHTVLQNDRLLNKGMPAY